MPTLRTFLASAISVALTLGALELLVRLTIAEHPPALLANVFAGSTEKPTWGQLDNEMGWVNKEGSDFVSAEGPPFHRVTNWDGYRRASAPQKPTNDATHRIWVFGDSFSEGQGTLDPETFAWRLNDQSAPRVVENFGTPGYSTFQAAQLMRKVFRERPNAKVDLVILGFTPFMSWRDVMFWSDKNALWDVSTQATVRPPFVTLRTDGSLETSPRWITDVWPLETTFATIAVAHSAFLKMYQGLKANATRDDLRGSNANQLITANIIQEANALATAKGARLIVPFLEAGSAPDWKWLRDALDAAGIPNIACDIPGRDLTYYNGGLSTSHPSGKYHKHFADCIQKWIAAN